MSKIIKLNEEDYDNLMWYLYNSKTNFLLGWTNIHNDVQKRDECKMFFDELTELIAKIKYGYDEVQNQTLGHNLNYNYNENLE